MTDSLPRFLRIGKSDKLVREMTLDPINGEFSLIQPKKKKQRYEVFPTGPDGVGTDIATGATGPADTFHLLDHRYTATVTILFTDLTYEPETNYSHISDTFIILFENLFGDENTNVIQSSFKFSSGSLAVGFQLEIFVEEGKQVPTASKIQKRMEKVIQHDMKSIRIGLKKRNIAQPTVRVKSVEEKKVQLDDLQIDSVDVDLFEPIVSRASADSHVRHDLSKSARSKLEGGKSIHLSRVGEDPSETNSWVLGDAPTGGSGDNLLDTVKPCCEEDAQNLSSIDLDVGTSTSVPLPKETDFNTELENNLRVEDEEYIQTT